MNSTQVGAELDRMAAHPGIVGCHTGSVLAVAPCCSDPEVLFVAHGQHRGVDWIALQRMARKLGELLRSSA